MKGDIHSFHIRYGSMEYFKRLQRYRPCNCLNNFYLVNHLENIVPVVWRHGDLIIRDLRFLGNILRVIVASGLMVALVSDGGEQHGDGDVLAHLKLIRYDVIAYRSSFQDDFN